MDLTTALQELLRNKFNVTVRQENGYIILTAWERVGEQCKEEMIEQLPTQVIFSLWWASSRVAIVRSAKIITDTMIFLIISFYLAAARLAGRLWTEAKKIIRRFKCRF